MVGERVRVYLTILILVLGLLVVGTAGYLIIEGWSFLDAFYMVVITLTTVGFREVAPLSPAGQIFTILLLVFGLIIVLYVLRLFSEYIIEDKISDVLRAGKVSRMVKSLQNPVIVVGFGRVGRHAALELRAAGAEVVVIERDKATCEKAESEGFLVLPGEGSDEELLKTAGILRAKALLAAAGDDSENVLIAITAKALNPNLFIVARSNSEAISHKLLRIGASRVVTPSQTGGFRMASFALSPMIVDFLDEMTHPAKKEAAVADLTVRAGSRLAGGTIKSVEDSGAVVLALQRKGSQVLINPKRELPIQAEDRLVIWGDRQAIGSVKELAE